MPTPCAMFRILSVTCLLTRKEIAFNYYSRLAHVLHVERFCIRIYTLYVVLYPVFENPPKFVRPLWPLS